MYPLENKHDDTAPLFIRKLWNMVENPLIDDVICWSDNGKSFLIKNESKFWYTTLPLYYKHNNMSSFIRQLNMYSFRKMPNVINDTEDNVDYQFIHPYFKRGEFKLLKEIKRKTANPRVLSSTTNITDQEHLNKVTNDVSSLLIRQAHADAAIMNLKKENGALWREVAILRQKHQKQEQILNKLIHFLGSLMQQTRMGGGVSQKRRSLMIDSIPCKKRTTSGGPTIHELDSSEVVADNMFVDLNAIDNVKIDSPASINSQNPVTSEEGDVGFDTCINMSKHLEPGELLCDLGFPEDTNISGLEISEMFDENIPNQVTDSEQVFVDPSTQNILLSSVMNGSYNSSNDISVNKKAVTGQPGVTNNMSLATFDNILSNASLNSIEDIDKYLAFTQTELEQIKKIFNNCSSVDAKALLQIFNEVPLYGLTPADETPFNNPTNMLDCTDITPYEQESIDFSDLLDAGEDSTNLNSLTEREQLNTPETLQLEPIFPLRSSNY